MGRHIGNGLWESDNTGIVLQCEYDNHYVDGETGDWYEKDMSGQWWVDFCGGHGESAGEIGPFNTLEHACECVEERRKKEW